MMLKFVTKAFRGFLEVSLWINLIGCAIAGAWLGAWLRRYDEGFLGGLLGLILGAAIGFITNVLGGGYIATVIRTNVLVKKIAVKMNALEMWEEDSVKSYGPPKDYDEPSVPADPLAIAAFYEKIRKDPNG
jgi:hypothetical protein